MDTLYIALEFGRDALWLCIQIGLGLLIADFVSGFFHWAQDRYGSPNWPIVGRVVRMTVRHHKRPRRMLRSPFWQRNNITMAIACTFGLAFFALGWINPTTITGVLIGAFANEIHYWSHRKNSENGPIIVALQKSGLILSPLAHARHHRGKKNTHFCAVTGWMNWPLEQVRFWRRLEMWIKIIARERPRRDPSVRVKPILA